MAADEINQAGGINGRQIDIVIEDDKGSPEEAAQVTGNSERTKDRIYRIHKISKREMRYRRSTNLVHLVNPVRLFGS